MGTKTEFEYCLTSEQDPCGEGLKCKSMREAFAYGPNFQPPPGGTSLGDPSTWFSKRDGICIQQDYDKSTDPPLVGGPWDRTQPLRATRYLYKDTNVGTATVGPFIRFDIGNRAGDKASDAIELLEPIQISFEDRIFSGKQLPAYIWNGSTVTFRFPDTKARSKWLQLNNQPYFSDQNWEFDSWQFVPPEILPILQRFNPTLSTDLRNLTLTLRIGTSTESETQLFYRNNAGSRVQPSFKESIPSQQQDSSLSNSNQPSQITTTNSTGAGSGQGVAGKMGRTFETVGEFASTLSVGVQEDINTALNPVKIELNQVKAELGQLRTLLGDATAAAAAAAIQAQNAASAAAAAQTAADNAQTTANNPPIPPPVTVVVTPPTTTGTPSTGTGGGEQPTPEPTVTPPVTSETPRVADQLVLALAEPFLLDEPVSTVSGGGTYAIGDVVTLRTTSPRSGYTFDGWYNSSGQRVATTPEYQFTVQSGGGSFTARFVGTTTEALPTPTPPETSDGRVNVTIKWIGFPTGTRNVNGQLVRDLRIGTNPGNVTQIREARAANTALSTRVVPGTQLVLNVFGGNNEPSWRLEGSTRTLREGFEFRPTVPAQDVTYVAVYTR